MRLDSPCQGIRRSRIVSSKRTGLRFYSESMQGPLAVLKSNNCRKFSTTRVIARLATLRNAGFEQNAGFGPNGNFVGGSDG